MAAAHAQTPAPGAPVTFRSAFEGYQPYNDDKVVDWKEANDNTARIGGWRAYARQMQQPEQPQPAPVKQQAADAPATPEPHADHSGHAKP